MRSAARLKLGFYPLPVVEAERLRKYLVFPKEGFSALDPCVGDGVAFSRILEGANACRYGVEIESGRVEQARALGIDTLHADALDVRYPAGSLSLLYLNPPYDFEVCGVKNQRLELVFLRHTCRFLQPGGVLLFVIPQAQLQPCARLMADEFTGIRALRLTEPDCVRYKQIVVLATRRKRHDRLRDSEIGRVESFLIELATSPELPALADDSDCSYAIPAGGPVAAKNNGLDIDTIEDLILASSAYRQVARALMRRMALGRGRPITPLHGGHVGLLCTAGMLNGVFGEKELRHISHWQSRKFTKSWTDVDDDGTEITHKRESYTHELTLVFENGRTKILTHERVEDADATPAAFETVSAPATTEATATGRG